MPGDSHRPLPHRFSFFSVFMLGALGMIAQAAFLREVLASFRGGEFTTGAALLAWLFWTALGSILPGRIALRIGHAEAWFHSLLPLYGLLGYLGIVLTGSVPLLRGLTPGEAVPYDFQVLAVVLAMAPFSVLGGFLFALGARMLARPGVPNAGRAYTAEALGAALGGLAFSAVLVGFFANHTLALAIPAATALLSAAWSIRAGHPRLLALLPLTILCIAGIDRLHTLVADYPYRGQELLEQRETRYSRLRATRAGGQITVYADAAPLFSAPNPEACEHDAHFPMLAARNPRWVLVLGGAPSGVIAEVLKYPTVERVTMVEIDPEVFALAERHLGPAGRNDPRVETATADGRAFLIRNRVRFDVIIMHMPEPLSGQANRYYTREFFRLAAARLAPDGVLGFALAGAENYIPEDLARFLASVRGALGEVFPSVTVLPGIETRVLASPAPGNLDSLTGEELERRRLERGIETFYVRDWFLRYTLSPERTEALLRALDAARDTPVNSDLRPAGYFLRTILQGNLDNSRLVRTLEALTSPRTVIGIMGALLVLFLALALSPGRGSRERTIAASVLAVGLTEISLEVLAIMMYQSFFGFLYGRIALLTGAYMAGLALGGLLGTRRTEGKGANPRTVAHIQIGIGFAALAWAGLFALGGMNVRGFFVEGGFYVLTALAGFLGGMQFPLADSLFRTARSSDPGGGAVYGLDLAGSAAGALFMASLVFPVLGIYPALLFLAGVNLAVAGAVAGRGSV